VNSKQTTLRDRLLDAGKKPGLKQAITGLQSYSPGRPKQYRMLSKVPM
jgi:hypothetical protein